MRLLDTSRQGARVSSVAAGLLRPTAEARGRSPREHTEQRHAEAFQRLRDNHFDRRALATCRESARLAELLWHLSLGTLGARTHDDEPPLFRTSPGSPTFRTSLSAGASPQASIEPGSAWGSRLDAGDTLCARLCAGEAVDPADLRILFKLLGTAEPWAHTLVTSMILCDAFLARGMVGDAAATLEKAVDAHRGLRTLARRHAPDAMPKELDGFEKHCVRVLASFEPPVPAGEHPIQKLRAVCRRQPTAPRTASRKTIDALDAVITAGQSADQGSLEARVVEQLARMLGGRVLFHYAASRYLQCESQAVHTLSSWTMRRLVRTTAMRALRIKRRPEFWRPEQRRPRGLLVFPVGDGVAAIARSRPFRTRDLTAARTILRFLDARRGRTPTTTAARRTEQSTPRRRHAHLRGLIGSSAAWSQVLRQVWRVGPADCSVVLQGETGTGKELVARALHMTSTRADHAFVAVNCAAVHPEAMLSELFGHIRGAFTGAVENRDGLVREAHRGTLFLDEVGDMPAAMQIALLRTLQEKSVRPVGSTRTKPADIRLVVATNQSLERLVQQGSFREDLYHRLHVMEIDLPPLRERLGDIPELATHILSHSTARDCTLPTEALAVLARYDWPGNVRELENVLQAAVLLGDGARIDAEVIDEVLETRRRALRRQPAATRLEPRAARVIDLTGDAWLSAPALARALGVSSRTVNRDLARLVERGLMEHHGEARARRYRVCRDSS